MNMSEELKVVISCVAFNIHGDFIAQRSEDDPEMSEEEVLAEIVLDAKRLEMEGYVQEQAELTELIKTHGWANVVKAVAGVLGIS